MGNIKLEALPTLELAKVVPWSSGDSYPCFGYVSDIHHPASTPLVILLVPGFRQAFEISVDLWVGISWLATTARSVSIPLDGCFPLPLSVSLGVSFEVRSNFHVSTRQRARCVHESLADSVR